MEYAHLSHMKHMLERPAWLRIGFLRPPQVHCAPPLIISEGDAASGSGLVGWCLNTLNILRGTLNMWLRNRSNTKPGIQRACCFFLSGGNMLYSQTTKWTKWLGIWQTRNRWRATYCGGWTFPNSDIAWLESLPNRKGRGGDMPIRNT
jgi:hypothetical protein